MSGSPWGEIDREAIEQKHLSNPPKRNTVLFKGLLEEATKHNESERPMEATIRANKLRTAFKTAGLLGPSPSAAYTEPLAEPLLLPGSSPGNGSQRKRWSP